MNSPWHYKEEKLNFDNKDIVEIAKDHPTPFYLYSLRQLERNYLRFSDSAKLANISDALICFALKANPNKEILRKLASLGSGADIVSGGELRRALECGIDPQKIVFSGVGKQDWEIQEALNAHPDGIYSFNVESIEELRDIARIAQEMKKVARVAFRLNPKVNALTHKHISTGFKTHKFGLLKADILDSLEFIKNDESLNLVGLSIHIGSQLTCMKATEEALFEVGGLALKVSDYLQKNLEFIDVGGGLGIDYAPEDKEKLTTPRQYMDLVSKTITAQFHPRAIPRIVFEPGRVIVARAGTFITKVIRTKVSEDCKFIIVDGGMNDFVRASLYEAYHGIYPALLREGMEKVDIVGPICETADCFATGREISPVSKGDILAVADAGAYGFSMASQYNMRDLPSEVVIQTKESKGELKEKSQ
jgi:diaminopimelate decarboxylase